MVLILRQVSPLLLAVSAVMSQTIAAQESVPPELEEIVVTAQKRAQNVQDVGIAISVFTGEQMQRLGMQESTDIAALTPGVNISASAGDQSRQFSIRGVTQNDFADHTESPNAVYVDEGYIAAPQGQVFALFDLDRVEVLKGPQGTLFGRNATGGLVHYITKKPTKDFEATADVTYGSYDQVRFEGALSGPLTDTLSARLAVLSDSHGPIVKNIYPYGNPTDPLTGDPYVPSHAGQDGFWNDNQTAARLELLWEPSASVSLLVEGFAAEQLASVGAQFSVATTGVLNANGNQINTVFAGADPKGCDAISATGDCSPIYFVDGKLPGAAATRPVQGGDLFGYMAPSPNSLMVSSDHTPDNGNAYHTRGGTANLTWNLSDSTSFHSISHYVYSDKRQTLDVDVAPEPQSIVNQLARNRSFTEELRLNGADGRLRWVAGLYYLHIGVDYLQGFDFSSGSPISTLFFKGLATEDPIIVGLKTNSYAAFAQTDFDLTDQLTLVVGARGTKEKKDFSYDNYWYASTNDSVIDTSGQPLNIPISAAGGGDRYPSYRGKSDDNLGTGKAQLEFKPVKGVLLYGGYSRGAKAGGFNAKLNDFSPAAPDSGIPYRPEKLNAYETGFKSTFLDGTSRLNGALYYYDYKGYQAFVFSGSSGLIQNTDAKYKGAELQFETHPAMPLTFMLGGSFIDATVEDLAIAPGVIRDVRPTYTPKWKFDALARYELPFRVAEGGVSLELNGLYQTDSYYNLRNFTADRMPGYAKLDARLAWVSASGRWGATFFVDNLTDRHYEVGGFDLATFCGCNEVAYGKPRWYGLRVHASTN
jgi:iron complex outermembrane receptor protein